MTLFKCSALVLASTLALVGCGGDGDSGTNDGSTTPSARPGTDPTLSEIDQAKLLVRTAKLFVSDGNVIKTAYEDTADLLTDEQQERMNDALDLADDIKYYMIENNVAKLTAADIIALADNEKFKKAIYPTKLTPQSDFMAMVDSNDKFTMSGSTSIKSIDELEYKYNPVTKKWERVATYRDTFTTSYNGYVDTFLSLANSDTYHGNFSFDSIIIGTGNDKVELSSINDGFKVQGQFNQKVTVDEDFDLEDEHEKGVFIEKVVANLDSIKLVANDSVIEAKNLKISAMDITNQLADGSTIWRTVPYEFALTGHLLKQVPKTDVEVTVNLVANESDIKKYITLDSEDDFVESAGDYVGMTGLLAIKGEVTKKGATTIPLDFQANIKRSGRDVIQLEELSANVDGKALFVTGQTDLDADYNVTGTTLTVMQNHAYLTLKMDADNEFIQDSSHKLGDIMVGNTDYGDLYDVNGQITAKFIDNSFIGL